MASTDPSPSGTSGLRLLLRPYRWRIAGAVGLAAITAAPSFMTMIIIGFVVDAVRAGDSAQVVRWSLTLAGVAVIAALLWIPRAWAVSHVAVDTEASIRMRFFDRVLRADLTTIDTLDVGQVVSRGTADLRLIRSFLTDGVAVTGQVVAGYAYLVVTAGYRHPLLGLATLVPVLLVLTLALLRIRTDTRAPTVARGLIGDATTGIDECLEAIDVIRSDNARDRAYARISALVERARQALTPVIARNAAFTAVLTAIPYLAFAGVLAAGAALLARGDAVSLGGLVTVSLLMLQVAAPTTALGSTVGSAQEAVAAADRIDDVLAWPDAAGDPRQQASQLDVQDLTVNTTQGPLLRGIDLQLSAPASLGIQGDAGSGKTTLVRALHGLHPQVSGTLAVPKTTLVTSDDAVFSGTLRDAVTYGRPEATDEQVAEAARRSCFDQVVAALPHGWDTPIGGTGGAVLSGGEVQRLRLARGLLMDAPVMLLDSVTVGLDAATLATVEGGIAEQSQGRMLVTVATHDSNLGPTTQRATLAGGALTAMPAPPAPPAPSDPLPTHDPAPAGAATTTAPAAPASEIPATVPAAPAPAHAAPAPTPADLRRHRREAARHRRQFIGALVRPDRGWVALALACVAIAAVAGLVPLYLSIDLLAEVTDTGGSGRLGAVVAGLVAVAVIGGLAVFGSTFLIPWLGQRALARLRLRGFRSLLDVHLAYFDRQRVGAIVSKLTNNIELLETAVTGSVGANIGALVTLIVVGGVLLLLDLELALVAYLVIPVIAVFALILRRAQRWALSRNVAGITDVTVALRDAVVGAATIRAFGTQARHRAQFDRLNDLERTALLRSAYVFKAFAAATQLVVALDVALIVDISGQDAVAGALAVATMVLFSTYLQNGISPVATIATTQAVYGQTGVALDQVSELALLHPDPQLAADQAPADPQAPAPPPALRYDHVWFAYSKAGWVLMDASLDVQPGEHLVIVGRTGGGKSSLIKLAMRFYSPIKGSIEVFGSPVATVREDWLRAQIAYVPQEPMLFSGTVLENLLDSRPDAPQAVVDEVIDALGMRETVLADLGGLQGRIGSGEAEVPAGHRQLISIARALIAQRPILILDEATSHLDDATEQRVIDALKVGDPNRTVLAIAHHLQWATRGDRVAMVFGHRIAEVGTHDELLAAHGHYAHLWRMQGQEQDPPPPASASPA